MSLVIAEDDRYTYEILQEKDCVECATFLAQSFTKHNPFEIYMKTTFEEFYQGALSLCKLILNTNLSIIARSKQTHEIHGIVQGVDAKTFHGGDESTETTDGVEKQVDFVLVLMHESEQQYLKDYEKKYGELKENSVAHILMVGIRSDCHGQGLGTKLNQVFLENVRHRGFKHIIVDTTSPTIEHIYTGKLNGKVFISVSASTWTTKNAKGEDHRPFEHYNSEIKFIVIDL